MARAERFRARGLVCTCQLLELTEQRLTTLHYRRRGGRGWGNAQGPGKEAAQPGSNPSSARPQAALSSDRSPPAGESPKVRAKKGLHSRLDQPQLYRWETEAQKEVRLCPKSHGRGVCFERAKQLTSVTQESELGRVRTCGVKRAVPAPRNRTPVVRNMRLDGRRAEAAGFTNPL